MNESRYATDLDDVYDCPECHGNNRDCLTCGGTGGIDRRTLDERREDARANDETWKDAE